jgi:hypothetical protein
LSGEFLPSIRFRRVTLEFEVRRALELRPMPGSALRGALGYLLRPLLCEAEPKCEGECRQPEVCRYYSLFERERREGGAGPNVPKPYILDPPIPPEFDEIVAGGPVRAPFEAAPPWPGESIPLLRCDQVLHTPPGVLVPLGLTLFGSMGAILPALLEVLVRRGLPCAGGLLALRRVLEPDGAVLYDRTFCRSVCDPPERTLPHLPRTEVRRMRVFFRTPVRLNLGGRICYDPLVLGGRLFQHFAVRAIKIYNEYCAPAGGRLPWMEAPSGAARVARFRLFHYVLPRYSNRQERGMRFDGVVGWMDLEGNLGEIAPFARAAEVLHVGQKAAFGLGRVRCVMET